ncbi:MAG: polyphosphate kinase 1, partial [Treponema sp.]|nr:polyphosphate kinase 1 [Treponema sp.]
MDNPETSETSVPCLSRDLSWVDFNERVLNEGLRKEMPPLERLRFLAIVSSNFDEFFMVRVAALKRSLNTADPCGLTPAQQLKAISEKVHSIMRKQYDCLRNEIFPGLAKNGLSLLRPDSWSVPQLDFLNSYFVGQVYPVLTPLRLEDEKPMPFIESRLLHAAFLLEPETPDAAQPEKLKIIVPMPRVMDRIVWLSSSGSMTVNGQEKEKLQLVLLEDIITTWGAYLFPGYRVKESMLFKINRDADFSVDEQRDEDFIEAMSEVLEGRDKSDVIR